MNTDVVITITQEEDGPVDVHFDYGEGVEPNGDKYPTHMMSSIVESYLTYLVKEFDK